MPYMHDGAGADIKLRGYGVVFGALSASPRDGFYEYFAPNAFDGMLQNGPVWVKAVAHHEDAWSFASARVWTDAIGLAFETSAILSSPRNRGIVAAVIGGERGVSWSCDLHYAEPEDLYGLPTRAIYAATGLEHISPVAEPMFPATTCWTSHEPIEGLPGRVQSAAHHWIKGHSATQLAANRRAMNRRRKAA